MADVPTETIATALTELMGENYGHRPASARAIWAEDVIVVLLEETFSKAELKLIELGQVDDIKHIRRSWQAAMEEDFRQIVEEATGRKVTAFVSDTDVAAKLAVEVFTLGAATTDMEAFEGEVD
jgi:uncharacterized protein YbcI